ncbi:MAG: hypothetical protein R3F56_05450 [Planctomycetota bacterium]
MFADAFWPNFLVFVLGQLVAWGYLATGRVERGACLMLGMLVLADVALVARFAYGAEHLVVWSLVIMQAYALVEAAFFVFGRWYRRQPQVRDRRREEYRAALVAELRGDDSGALEILQRLCRRDPWDVEATLASATVQRRLGRTRRAGTLLRRARRLDRDARLSDLVFLESARLQGAAGGRKASR